MLLKEGLATKSLSSEASLLLRRRRNELRLGYHLRAFAQHSTVGVTLLDEVFLYCLAVRLECIESGGVIRAD